jgi:hypothetical protein
MANMLTPKLHHMRVHPMDAEGKIKVTHHASTHSEPVETHHFGHGEHEEMSQHIMEHSGMPMVEAEE